MFPVGMEKLQVSLAFRSSFSAYLLLIQTLPTYQKRCTGQKTTHEQVFLQDFWHFCIRFQMETPMRTASILIFLAHSVAILTGNLNWEENFLKKAPTTCHAVKSYSSSELCFDIRKQETMFSVLSSVVYKHGCGPEKRFGLSTFLPSMLKGVSQILKNEGMHCLSLKWRIGF